MNEKARQLASQGKTNAEIFGELEISSAALRQIASTNPQLIFSIIQGRSEHTQALFDILLSFAAGEVEQQRGQTQVIFELLNRADSNNRALTAAHDLILIAGTSFSTTTKHDPATVTQLLRSVK